MKFGDPKQVCDANERGRQDARDGKLPDSKFKKHRNKAVAKAYRNGYGEGQRMRAVR